MARARTTAPSLWLPGFDPDSPEIPEPPSAADPFSAAPVQEAIAASEPSTATEPTAERPPAEPRTSWRVIAGAKSGDIRCLWPMLGREQLRGLRVCEPIPGSGISDVSKPG